MNKVLEQNEKERRKWERVQSYVLGKQGHPLNSPVYWNHLGLCKKVQSPSGPDVICWDTVQMSTLVKDFHDACFNHPH